MRLQEKSCKGPMCLFFTGLIITVLASIILYSPLVYGEGAVGDYEFIAQSVHPNVLVILDTSNSMDEDIDGNAVGSNAPNSRSEIARQAILSIINSNASKMRFGLMAYQQSGVQRYEIHNSFYYCSYDPSTYNPAGTPTPKDPSTNTRRWPNPADPGHYIYYDQALPMYSSWNLGNAYAYSRDYNETVDPETGNYYYVYQTKTGDLDPPPGVSSGGLGAYGYSSYWFGSRFVPTDEDYAAGYQYFGRQLSWVHVGPTWFSNTSPGMGYLHVPITDTTSAHLTALQDKLATSQFSTSTDTPLRNAGLTPIAGTLESARHYFEGSLAASNQGGPQSTPVQYSCQRNFIVLVTDGLPSVGKNGNPNDADSLLPGVKAEVTSLRTTSVTGFPDPFDVQTFVLGFALPPALGSKLDDIAVAGGTDVNGHAYLAGSAQELSDALQQIFLEVLNRGTSYVAPVVSVDEANRTQNGDDLYIAFFKPLTGDHWRGNLKKYSLSYLPRTDCGRTEAEWTVMDQTDSIAGNCDGSFKSTTRSFWLPESEQADGGEVDKGGVGGLLKTKVNGAFTNGTYYTKRNILTYKGTALMPFNATNVSNSDLDVTTDVDRYKIINFMYGYTYDTQTNGNPVATRDWVLGDIIHSEPRIIDYLSSSGDLAYRFVAVGANDGMLHVFLDSPDTATFGGKTYTAGDEIFAFVPSDLLTRLKEFEDANVHLHMVDGSCNLFRATSKTGGYYDKTLVFGERRGGRSYWALDVTNPDPSQWTVKWHIEGGTGDYAELGYSWSKPYFARLRTAADTVKEIVILSGGYDPLEDGYPEAFDDADNDGIRDTGETFTDTVGGTSGSYDKYNPGKDTMGRGIFVVDLSDGSVLFKAIYGDVDNDEDETEDVTTGINQQYCKMKYCFPADISVIPFSESKIVMYAADIYGQIWKVTYDYYNDLSHTYTDTDSTKWRAKRIFTANPGSSLADHMYSGDADAFTAGGTLNTGDQGRKMFYSPDVSYYGNCWTSNPVLYFGTGDRAHPRYAMTSNRFYVVADHDTLTDENDLLNLTCDELDEQADSDGDGDVDADDATRKEDLIQVLRDESICRGFYRVMDAQTQCSDESISHAGEKILSQPTVFFKNVYFTSYKPVFDDPCNPNGNAFIYALDYCWGKSVFNYHDEGVGNPTVRNIKDTYLLLSNSSIPSGVRVVTRGGHAAGLISAGGAVSGVGEDQSTNIPGPPGGVSQILWETR